MSRTALSLRVSSVVVSGSACSPDLRLSSTGSSAVSNSFRACTICGYRSSRSRITRCARMRCCSRSCCRWRRSCHSSAKPPIAVAITNSHVGKSPHAITASDRSHEPRLTAWHWPCRDGVITSSLRAPGSRIRAPGRGPVHAVPRAETPPQAALRCVPPWATSRPMPTPRAPGGIRRSAPSATAWRGSSRARAAVMAGLIRRAHMAPIAEHLGPIAGDD